MVELRSMIFKKHEENRFDGPVIWTVAKKVSVNARNLNVIRNRFFFRRKKKKRQKKKRGRTWGREQKKQVPVG